MTKWILAAGAAAIALSAPSLAQPGKGGGGDKAHAQHGGGGGHGGQKAERGGGGGKPERAQQDRQRGGEMRHAQRSEQRQERHFDRQEAKREQRVERRDDKREARLERRDDKREARFDRGNARSDVRIERNDDRRDVRRLDDDRRFANDDRFRNDDGRSFAAFRNDCPPGLVRKNNGCLPPGQAKKLIGAALPSFLASRALEGPYTQWYRDDDRYLYRNDGDYIYRVDRNRGLIDSLFPFQDRDYSYYPVGMTYPSEYNSYNVPYQYQSFYPDGNDYLYRYGDGAIYQVDRSNNGIESIVALLAGDLGVGQQLPGDYGVYNVPMAYRDRYYDTPDALYRYNDGYIYQADPKTQLITAVIDALV